MKKKMLLIIPLCLVIAGCSLFKKSADDIEALYQKVLSGDQAYINGSSKSEFIEAYLNDYHLQAYAYVDFNNDETPDMVVSLQKNKYEKIFLILSYSGNKVYGIKVDDETLLNFTNEGYGSFIDVDNGTSGWRTYKINKGKLTYDVKAIANDEKTDCKLDGKSLDCEEYSSKLGDWLTESTSNPEWKQYKKE